MYLRPFQHIFYIDVDVFFIWINTTLGGRVMVYGDYAQHAQVYAVVHLYVVRVNFSSIPMAILSLSSCS